MALVTRGRLSVQRVEKQTWEVIRQLADKGGWDCDAVSSKKTKPEAAATPKGGRKTRGVNSKGKRSDSNDEDKDSGNNSGQHDEEEVPVAKVRGRGRKRKAEEVQDETAERTELRRSTRAKK